MLGRLGIRAIFYLDVILVLGSSYQFCFSNTQESLSNLMKAGFLIDWEKSSLIPSTIFLFLRMLWDSVGGGVLALPEVKLGRLQARAAFLLQQSAPMCQQVLVLTGFVAVFHRAMPLLRLKGRFVQLSLFFGSGSSGGVGSPPKMLAVSSSGSSISPWRTVEVPRGSLWRTIAPSRPRRTRPTGGWGCGSRGPLRRGGGTPHSSSFISSELHPDVTMCFWGKIQTRIEMHAFS